MNVGGWWGGGSGGNKKQRDKQTKNCTIDNPKVHINRADDKPNISIDSRFSNVRFDLSVKALDFHIDN